MAVSRRQKENDTFNDIASTLPIEESAKELDKASVLRIAIHYLRLRDVLADCETTDSDASDSVGLHSTVPNFSKDVLQALDGFLMMVSKDGRILYATESISQYLGLRQVDVIGVHVQDIIHPQDYSEVAAVFQSQGHDIGPEMEIFGNKNLHQRNFVVRMRCAFTPSVRSITRCSNFKPIYCSGFLKFSKAKVKDGEFLGMVMLCKLAGVTKVRELCIGAFFKTKHSLDLGYTAVDTRIRWILGFDPAEMVGLKAYNYFHPEDLLATSSCHTSLLVNGRSHSPCYRFMTRSGEWVWVKSKSCITYDPITHLPNGLSIYTWIVRHDEEDERMKIIVDGKDPGDIGVKDTSNTSSNTSLNIKELCDPFSSPMKKKDVPKHSLKSVSPLPQLPPNVNPFQSPPHPNMTSPPAIYDNTASNDPFMGTTVLQNMSPPQHTINSNSFANCRQSSLDSQTETSPPPYTANMVGYSYSSPTNSPYNGSSSSQYSPQYSPQETICYYNSPPPPIPHQSLPPISMTEPNYSSSEYYPSNYPLPSFAVDTTVYTSDCFMQPPVSSYPNSFMMPQSFGVKQEMEEFPCLAMNNTNNKHTIHHSSRDKIKAQYMKIGVGGSHISRGPATNDDNAIISSISQWLQHSVH